MKKLSSNTDLDLLILFIREEIGEYNLDITENSILEDDLGITGDDAFDLIQNFSKRYNVDISNFEYKKYFNPEPSIFNSVSQVKQFKIINLFNAIESRILI